jgi:hypothetical protein
MSYDLQTLRAQVIKPGIYFDMSDEEYHGDKSLSNSGMGKLLHSPRGFWLESNFNKNKKPMETAALKMGRAFHTLFLEPHKFAADWEIKPNCQGTKAKGMIGEGDYRDMLEAKDSLMEDPIHASLFTGGYPEVAIFWVDEATGVPCRMKTDYLSLRLAVDLKSTADSSIYKLGYSIADYGYYRQAAFYMHAIEQIKTTMRAGAPCVVKDCPSDKWMEEFLKTVHDKFVFAFQEKKSPYLNRVAVLGQSITDHGVMSYQYALQVFKGLYEEHGESKYPKGNEGIIEVLEADDLIGMTKVMI